MTFDENDTDTITIKRRVVEDMLDALEIGITDPDILERTSRLRFLLLGYPSKEKTMTKNEIKLKLKEAIKGLSYMSETDYPVDLMTSEDFKKLDELCVKVQDEEAVETFFATGNADSPAFGGLRQCLGELQNVVVLHVPRADDESEIDIYIYGHLFTDQGVARIGVKTMAVET